MTNKTPSGTISIANNEVLCKKGFLFSAMGWLHSSILHESLTWLLHGIATFYSMQCTNPFFHKFEF